MPDSPAVEPVNQPVPPPHPKTNWWRIATLFLIFLFVGGGLFQTLSKQTPTATIPPTILSQLSPTISPLTSPTAGWKTYQSAKYNFTVKYPSNWKALETPTQIHQTGNDQLWLSPENDEWPPPNTGARSALVFSFSESDPEADWQPQYFNNYQKKVYPLGDVIAYKISGTNKEGLFNETVVLVKRNTWYLTILQNGGEEVQRYFDQILSTFRFLDNNTQGRWKMYDAGSFTLNIPSSWQVSNNTGTYDFYSGLPGRVELIIGKTDKTVVQSKREIEGYFASTPQKRELTLGKATAVEYYGCAGVEGCMDQYILVISHGNQIYNLHFTLYPDQESELYSNIISSLKFK